jgi:DNA-binding NarL/FixJ family response regulator
LLSVSSGAAMKAAEVSAYLNDGDDDGLGSLVEEFAESYHLSPREKDVFRLVFGGFKNAVIARKIGIADTTVRLHITGIHRKIGTGNKVDLVIALLRWSLGRQGNASRPLPRLERSRDRDSQADGYETVPTSR